MDNFAFAALDNMKQVAPAINFADGVKHYTVNGVENAVSFNPTDSAFIGALYDAFTNLDKQQDAYRAEVSQMQDKRKIFDIARKRDAEMRGVIDGLFGEPVCSKIFGSMNVYAMADGLPAWANFMLAIIDEADATFATEQQKTNPRIAKYTEKYKKYENK